MKTRIPLYCAIALGMATAALSHRAIAQSPPGYSGAGVPAAPLLSPSQLQDLVGRFALYPDDLIALILPASTTPLEIVKAQRFLTKYTADKSLKPDASLSQPVMTLLSYPDVINFMGDDLDWTEALGQAFTDQQQEVLDAIQIFRRKAQSAGNLKSDDKQTIVVNEQTVQIVPAQPEVVYVPQYQPATVIVTQAAPVVTYAPTAYPIYYRPGAAVAIAATVAYGLNWYGGGVYRAPYAAHYNHIQEERMDYAKDAREDWQDYGKANREDWQNHANNAQSQRQQSASSNQSSRQQTSSNNLTQRQEAVSGGQQQRSANQTQRQNSVAGAQSSAQQGQAQRQSSAQSRLPSGAQSWQGSAQTRQTSGAGQAASFNRTASSTGQRQSAASSSQFGARPSSRPASGGVYSGASSGARAQSQSARGERSMSGASRSGGGRSRR